MRTDKRKLPQGKGISTYLVIDIDELIGEPYLTDVELCKVFGVLLVTINQWRARQALPSVRIVPSDGSMPMVRYRLVDVKQWATLRNREIKDTSVFLDSVKRYEDSLDTPIPAFNAVKSHSGPLTNKIRTSLD